MDNFDIIEVSEILEQMDLSEIREIIEEQLNAGEDVGVVSSQVTNFFHPIYIAYQQGMKSNDLNEDDKQTLSDAFRNVCATILSAIIRKFDLTIDSSWAEKYYDQLTAITIGMYDFFVIDLYNNNEEVILTYLSNHANDIVEVFDGMEKRKDVATTTNGETLSRGMALIASNIYDIILWIFDQLEDDIYLANLDQSYLPGELYRNMISEGGISGSFSQIISEKLRGSPGILSSLGFAIYAKIVNGELADFFPVDTAV